MIRNYQYLSSKQKHNHTKSNEDENKRLKTPFIIVMKKHLQWFCFRSLQVNDDGSQ